MFGQFFSRILGALRRPTSRQGINLLDPRPAPELLGHQFGRHAAIMGTIKEDRALFGHMRGFEPGVKSGYRWFSNQISGLSEHGWAARSRHSMNPAARGLGPDRGHGSAWRGIIKMPAVLGSITGEAFGIAAPITKSATGRMLDAIRANKLSPSLSKLNERTYSIIREQVMADSPFSRSGWLNLKRAGETGFLTSSIDRTETAKFLRDLRQARKAGWEHATLINVSAIKNAYPGKAGGQELRAMIYHERLHQYRQTSGSYGNVSWDIKPQDIEKISPYFSEEASLSSRPIKVASIEEGIAFGFEGEYRRLHDITNKITDPERQYLEDRLNSRELFSFARKAWDYSLDAPIPNFYRDLLGPLMRGKSRGLSHGGWAERSRHSMNSAARRLGPDKGHGSAWAGIIKLLPEDILAAVSRKFGRIWEQAPEQFARTTKAGAGIADYRPFSEAQVTGVLSQIQEFQMMRGGAKPGFQELVLPARGGLPEKLAIAYNTAFGETAAVGTMYRGPSGELIQGALVAAKQYRGKGLGPEIFKRMFQAGAIETQALSVAGAKSYIKVLRKLADDVARSTVNTESQFTTPAVAQRLNKIRGSRRMSGGNN